MDLQLSGRWTELLRRLPESGMGYQRVRLALRDGSSVPDVIVLNGRVLRLPDLAPSFSPEDITDIQLVTAPGR